VNVTVERKGGRKGKPGGRCRHGSRLRASDEPLYTPGIQRPVVWEEEEESENVTTAATQAIKDLQTTTITATVKLVAPMYNFLQPCTMHHGNAIIFPCHEVCTTTQTQPASKLQKETLPKLL
jgi:hypothetical protein